jgi:hypothetical protein
MEKRSAGFRLWVDRRIIGILQEAGNHFKRLASCIRLNNCIQSLGANANESALESLIANLANYPDRDPAKLIEAAAQISESGVPLEKLEEHVKALMAEKEALQRGIDEGRAILDGVYEDVESRTKLVGKVCSDERRDP